LQDKEEGRLKVNIYSRHKLKKDNITDINHFLKRHYKIDEPQIEEIIDESLIGGVKIRVENDIIDMTLSNQIKQLKNYLLQN
jgi:F0F1-type ATP synthase delta subunit